MNHLRLHPSKLQGARNTKSTILFFASSIMDIIHNWFHHSEAFVQVAAPLT